MADQLRETIPTFGEKTDEPAETGVGNMSALTSANIASSGRDALLLLIVAVLVVSGIQLMVNIFVIKPYVLP